GIYAVIAAQVMGLDPSETARYVASCYFVIGIGTILQAIRTRLTPGIPLVLIPNPVTRGAYILVVAHYGVGAAMGATILSTAIIIAMARFLPRMRAVFPPEVIGVVVMMLGLSMVTGGVER